VKLRWPGFVWEFALAGAFILSILAVVRGGYVGPDYPMHFSRLIEWPKVFDFSATSPPLYYLLGHGLFVLIGPKNAFPVTLSTLQMAINLAALWYFFRYTQQRFGSTIVHLALCLFLIFLPARIIHAVSIGTDSMTVPLFVLLLFLLDKFLRRETLINAALLGLALGAAVWVKYSFMALIPALFVIFVFLWPKRRWKLQQFAAICLLSLMLASGLSIHSFWASSRVHGYNTEKHWLNKGEAPDMDFKDLLWVKSSDLQLFRAPEYFKREILQAHAHSYLGLSHMGTFTDSMNLFQDLSVPQDFGSLLIPDQKTREAWKTPVMSMSMYVGVVWTFSALIGTAWLLMATLHRLFRGNLEREHVLILLGVAYFLLMFLPIPFVHAGALFGYWTPRLILPSLLAFFFAGFYVIDRNVAARSNMLAIAVFGLALFQCLIEIVMLA